MHFSLAIFFFVLAGLYFLVEGLVKASRPRGAKVESHSAPPRDPLPYARRKHFFSTAERSFYEAVRELLPHHAVFAKVRLADVLRVSKGSAGRIAHQNRINRRQVDFLICHRDLSPAAVVELDGTSSAGEEAVERDEFIDHALTDAALPIIHLPAQRRYRPEELRAFLSPHLGIPSQSAAEVAGSETSYLPRKGWRPAV